MSQTDAEGGIYFSSTELLEKAILGSNARNELLKDSKRHVQQAKSTSNWDKKMSLTSTIGSDSFPSDQMVEESMEVVRSNWAAKGLDETTCSKLNRHLQELASFPFGRFFIVNGSGNGYWTNFIATGEYKTIQNKRKLNESEKFVLKFWADTRHEQELLLREIIRPLLKQGVSVASVPSGLMSEILLAADKLENVKLHAIDLDTSNFDLIVEKYGDRLKGSEFHPIEMDALKLDFKCSFDLITCLGLSMYMKEELFPDFLSRLHRALKPGGRLLLSFLPDASEQSPLFQYDVTRNPIVQEIFMCSAQNRLTTRMSTSKLVRYFSQAGFENITIHGGMYYQLPLVNAVKSEMPKLSLNKSITVKRKGYYLFTGS